MQVTTDNKQRAAKDVRAAFNAHGGNLAQPGAVAFQFLHAGQFLVAQERTTEDRLLEIALNAGADDVITTSDGYEVRCNIHLFDKIAAALSAAGIQAENSEIAFIPNSSVPVTDGEVARSIVKLHDELEALDDVQTVFSNEAVEDAPANGSS